MLTHARKISHPVKPPSTSRPTRTHARRIPHLIEPPSTANPPLTCASRTSAYHYPPSHIQPISYSRQSNSPGQPCGVFCHFSSVKARLNSAKPPFFPSSRCKTRRETPQKICLRPFCGRTLPRRVGANAAAQRRRSARPLPCSDGGHMPASFRSPRPAERNEIRSRTQRQ